MAPDAQAAARIAVVVLGVGAVAVLRPSCGGTTPDATHADASGGASTGGASGAGSGGADGSGGSGGSGTGGSAGAPVYDGGVWQPTGDPEWTKIPWVDCGALYAKHPEHAVPPLVWKACEDGIPGCERMVVNWDYDFPALGTLSNSGGGVDQTSNGFVFIAILNIKGGPPITAAYADAKTPIAAWRGPYECAPWHFEWSKTHVCLTFGGLPPLRVGLAPLGAVDGAPLQTFQSAADVPVACNETKLFAMDTGNRYFARDHQSGALQELGWLQDPAYDITVRGEVALVKRSITINGKLTLQGWVWTPATGLTKLLDPANEMVFDYRTDGTTLVWVQSPAPDIQWWPGDIWTSPFSTDPAKLQPKKLRSIAVASPSNPGDSIGGGYYALIEPEKNENSPNHRLHVYRLSDGRHWEVPRFRDVAPGAEPNTVSAPSAVLKVDETEVWYQTASQSTGGLWTVARQRLDALGPGD